MARFVSYDQAGNRGFGLVSGGGVVALSDRLGVASLQHLIAQAGDLRRVEDRFGRQPADIALDGLRFLPPVLVF